MATKVIENSNTRLFGLIFFGKIALIYSSNWPKPFGKRKSRDSVHDVFRLQRPVGSVLDLQDYRRLDDFHRMPLSGRYLYAVSA